MNLISTFTFCSSADDDDNQHAQYNGWMNGQFA